MLPIAISVLSQLGDERHEMGPALLLSVAYGARIGGMATLIGTPPNALLAGFMLESYGIEIGFARWMLVGLPLAAITLPLAWLVLTRLAYPLRAGEALRKLGPVEALRCVASYAREQARPTTRDGSFESWVRQKFGRRLFEIFFKTYSEKLWGIPCNRLDADFAAQRIRQFSLGAAIRSALSREGRNHRTLVDQFAYPTGGTGMVYERMARSFCSRGGRLFLDTPVRRVLARDGRVTGIQLMNGTIRQYDQIISSMPLTALVARLPDVPSRVAEHARNLRFRNTILVYLEVSDRNIFRDNWIYVHSPDLLTGRITNFRNWVPDICGDSPSTILSLEYWCNNDDALWVERDEALVELGVRELRGTGLIGHESSVTNGAVYRIPKCYPVYDRTYRQNLRPVERYLRGIDGLQAIGRYGSFKYNNQDHSILMGMLAAANVLSGSGHDLWGVNADYEHYQEASRITETGLVNV
jgi:protoporphyrinogen oxidase